MTALQIVVVLATFASACPNALASESPSLADDAIFLSTSRSIDFDAWQTIVRRRRDDPIFLGRMLLHWPKTFRPAIRAKELESAKEMTIGLYNWDTYSSPQVEVFIRLESNLKLDEAVLKVMHKGNRLSSAFHNLPRPDDVSRETRVHEAKHRLPAPEPFAPIEVELDLKGKTLYRTSILLPYLSREMNDRLFNNGTCNWLPFGGRDISQTRTVRSLLAQGSARPLWTTVNPADPVPSQIQGAAYFQIECYHAFSIDDVSVIFGGQRATRIR